MKTKKRRIKTLELVYKTDRVINKQVNPKSNEKHIKNSARNL